MTSLGVVEENVMSHGGNRSMHEFTMTESERVERKPKDVNT